MLKEKRRRLEGGILVSHNRDNLFVQTPTQQPLFPFVSIQTFLHSFHVIENPTASYYR